jgi:hypothetical protein
MLKSLYWILNSNKVLTPKMNGSTFNLASNIFINHVPRQNLQQNIPLTKQNVFVTILMSVKMSREC